MDIFIILQIATMRGSMNLETQQDEWAMSGTQFWFAKLII
jgi:hypothetical protein